MSCNYVATTLDFDIIALRYNLCSYCQIIISALNGWLKKKKILRRPRLRASCLLLKLKGKGQNSHGSILQLG